MKPSICAAIIARNEERDLPKCIRSLRGAVSHIVVVDTGSTDRTAAAAEEAIPEGMRLYYERYFDASELNPDKPGEWRILNFSAARNHALELAEATGCSHIFWIDADDAVETPLALRRVAYLPDAIYGMYVELGGGVRQISHRLWPAAWKLRFKGWVHETPDIGNRGVVVLNDVCIRHDATPHEGAGEDSNARNLRILTAQYRHEPDARAAFYLANTHKDAGRWREAIHWYHVRLGYGDAWRDEYLFALLYLGRCLRAAEEREGARSAFEVGLAVAPDWQEFRMDLAFLAYQAKDYAGAIEEATRALGKPIPRTVLWREPNMYRDQPARLISWCHEHMGNLNQALFWSQQAGKLIGGPDADWARREAVLEQRIAAPQAPAVLHQLREKIALHRPGAIGDILMTLNLVPALKEANPGAEVHYFCHADYAKPDALGSIMLQAGVDMVMDAATLPQWRKHYSRVVDLVGYPLGEGYPERPMRQHLLHYFAQEMRLEHTDDLPALTLPRPHNDSPYSWITLQPFAGWSKYKQWSWDRWELVAEVAHQLCGTVVQIGGATKALKYATSTRFDRGKLSDAINAFANASMHIGIDSFCNHLTNYYWTDEHGGRRVPGVILWGSTQASAAGYLHNTNISLGLPCQPCFRENPAISRMARGPCINPPRATYEDDTPQACMNGINVEQVVEAVRAMWEQVSPKVAA